MLTKQQQRDVIAASDALAELLCRTVEATIEERSAEVARDVLAELVEFGPPDRDPEDDPLPVMTVVILCHLLSLVQEQLADRPEVVDEILTWIEGNLGKRYRLRARYVSGSLRSAEGVEEIGEYADALAGDFIPAIIWLLAGAVACCGGGDADWLRRIREAADPQRAR